MDSVLEATFVAAENAASGAANAPAPACAKWMTFPNHQREGAVYGLAAKHRKPAARRGARSWRARGAGGQASSFCRGQPVNETIGAPVVLRSNPALPLELATSSEPQ
jgi:hypothetical protein